MDWPASSTETILDSPAAGRLGVLQQSKCIQSICKLPLASARHLFLDKDVSFLLLGPSPQFPGGCARKEDRQRSPRWLFLTCQTQVLSQPVPKQIHGEDVCCARRGYF